MECRCVERPPVQRGERARVVDKSLPRHEVVGAYSEARRRGNELPAVPPGIHGRPRTKPASARQTRHNNGTQVNRRGRKAEATAEPKGARLKLACRCSEPWWYMAVAVGM